MHDSVVRAADAAPRLEAELRQGLGADRQIRPDADRQIRGVHQSQDVHRELRVHQGPQSQCGSGAWVSGHRGTDHLRRACAAGSRRALQPGGDQRWACRAECLRPVRAVVQQGWPPQREAEAVLYKPGAAPFEALRHVAARKVAQVREEAQALWQRADDAAARAAAQGEQQELPAEVYLQQLALTSFQPLVLQALRAAPPAQGPQAFRVRAEQSQPV